MGVSITLSFSISVLTLLGSLIAPPMTKALPVDDDRPYGLLLDAGSSGTRLKVYRLSPASCDACVPIIELTHSRSYEPGLSAFEDDDVGLRTYISNILADAKTLVPQKKQASTPIYLMATAGLRFLTSRDATELMNATREVFADPTVNPFYYTPEGITILSGEEEGVYAWLAANYLLGVFPLGSNPPANESVGVMEMGGGSMQIAFRPRELLFSEEFHVTVAKKLYQLYVQSYLQYGINAIVVKIASILSMENPGQQQLDDPCMLKGDSKDIELEDGSVVRLNGSSDPSKCQQILASLLQPSTGIDCQPKPCAIGSRYQPSVRGIRFYAISVFAYTVEDLNVQADDGVLDIDTLQNAAAQLCQKTLDQAVADGHSVKYASRNCLAGLYIPTLLTVSYGFPRDTQNILAVSKIGDQSIDWTLGAMLMELSRHHTGTSTVAFTRR